jgi:class 3 adenylate cyclase/tetratricopeptide (TPR) repeat protein
MSNSCPVCREQSLPPKSVFCLRCGTRLDAAADRAASYTPHHLETVLVREATRAGERKDVTVLVADVAGSLAMAERLDPEDVHILMDGFFALALDCVHAERGTLNQFRGDGFMALFGAPAALENHVVHAARAALAIRRASEEYNRSVRTRFGVPFMIRMGLHCGPVWVGSIGTALRRDYTAEGPTVGVAARLEQAASPGQILVSEVLAARVQPYAEVASMGSRVFRGVSAPVEVFELLRTGPYETALDVERDRGLGPLIGREGEIATLRARLGSTGRGTGLWLEVVGEAGAGKSRLAFEIRSREDVAWLEGRCREPEITRAFSIWTDLLRRWPPGLAGHENVAEMQRILEGNPAPRTPGEIETRLRALLDHAADDAPLSIHIEDAQWIDRASLRLVDSLLASPPAAGIRFLATSRPEGPGSPLSVERGERVTLAPLSLAESEILARGVLGDDPGVGHLVELAALQSEGNPLFALELARAFAAGDASLRRAARLELDRRRSVVRVPATLRDVIAARIDALVDPLKSLLQSASVVGRPFEPALLEALDPAESRERITALVEHGLLLAEGSDFDFHHDIVRDVVYTQMPRGRRQDLHRRCAEWLEHSDRARTPGGDAEIGWHYDLGGESTGAVHALARAGRGYLALFAAREATAHLGRAWELLAPLPASERGASERLSVGLALARALNTLDRAREAAAILERLTAEDGGGEDTAQLASACAESGWVAFSERGERDRALALVERGIALAREGCHHHIEAQGHSYRIRVCHLDARIDEAVESARRVAELGTAAGERFGAIFGIGNEGFVLCDAGRVERGLALVQEACGMAREAQNEVGRALTSAWLAKALVFRGDAEHAVRVAEEARELARAADQQGALYTAETWCGAALLLLGEPKRAAECFERLGEINMRWPTTVDWLAVASLETGHFAEAAEHARNCLAAEPARLVRVRTLGLALALGRAPDFERAEQAIGDSLSIAVECGLVPYAAAAHAALAELCARRGESHRVGYYSERARREWTSCGMVAHADHAERALG